MSKANRSEKKDTFIDMTAMSDVTVLLLTFFMLTANFIPQEPVQVVTPASVIETKVPDANLITILIDMEGKIYLNLDRPADKVNLLNKMGEMFNVQFTNAEKANFAQPTTFAGTPMRMMKQYLGLEPAQQSEFLEQLNGIPADSANNQLAIWIQKAKEVNEDLVITVKADQTTPYSLVRSVTSTLQDIKENRFSLVTQLRGMPEGL